MFSPLIVAKGMRKSNEKIENGPALPTVQQQVLKNLREKSKISQFIKNSPNCCICNFCKGGKMWYTNASERQAEQFTFLNIKFYGGSNYEEVAVQGLRLYL